MLVVIINYWCFSLTVFVNGNLTIQNYHDLAAEYEERLMDFNAQCRTDPFGDSDVKELEKICKKIETSKIFLMADKGKISAASVAYPEKEEYESLEVLNDFDSEGYHRMSVDIEPRVSERQIEVNLFPCPRKINDDFWYFSYGFVHKFIYVFKRKFPALEIEFLGLAEPRPLLSTSLMVDRRELERYFINAMAYRNGQLPIPSPIPEGEPLCWLNANQQFRLCCQVASALRDDKRMEMNCESFHVHNCEKRHLFLREIHENSSAYPGGDLFVNSITCGDQLSPNFLLVRDPLSANSVFVIRNSVEILKIKRNEQLQFMDLIAHVGNISALQHAKDFY